LSRRGSDDPVKLVIPSNWQPDLIRRVRGPGAHSIYAAMPETFVGGGRPSALIPSVSRRQAQAHIAEAHRAGLRFDYILNAPCLDNREFTRAGQRELHRLLRWIDGAAVDSVTVSVPYLLELIKRHHPRLRVNVSTIADVDGPHRARRWEEMGADCITLSVVGVGRSLRTIEAIRRAVGVELQIIANLTCDYQCPHFHYHTVTEGHASQRGHPLRGYFIDYCRASCLNRKMADPARYLRAPWIRPEDQQVYRDLGVDHLKLINRLMATDEIVKIVEAYRSGRYDGNLFDLLDFPPKPVHATRGVAGKLRLARYFARPGLVNPYHLSQSSQERVDPDAFYLDNRQLDGFIERFRGHDCADLSCGECRYCDDVASSQLRVSPAAKEMFAARTGALREGLISGALFRWGGSGAERGARRSWDRHYRGVDPCDLPWNRLPLFESTRALLRSLPLASMERALDMGCGSGEMTSTLQRETGLPFVGVDISGEAVRLARAGRDPRRKLQYLRSDVLALPLAEASFDLVIERGCLHSLRRADDRVLFFAEVHRVLRPGGRLILVTMGADPARPWASRCSRLLLRAVQHLAAGELERMVSGRFELTQTRYEAVRTPLLYRYLPLDVPALFQCHLLTRLD